jgi:hypothetical protein
MNAEFLSLTLTPLTKDLDGARVQIDGTPQASRLPGALVYLVVDRHHGSAHRQTSLIDVELMPEGAEEFAASHPGGGSEPERWVVAIGCGELEEAAEVVGGPYPFGSAGGASGFGPVGGDGRVVSEESSSNGVARGQLGD